MASSCSARKRSKLTAVLKRLHGASFNSLPFNDDGVSGNHLDSLLPSTNEDDKDALLSRLNELDPKPERTEIAINGDSTEKYDLPVSVSDLHISTESACPAESMIPVDVSENQCQEEFVENKYKASIDSNKKSKRKQQKTHRCVAMDDSLLGSPTPDSPHETADDGLTDESDPPGENPDNYETKMEVESDFDLPEGTVFVQPESVDTLPKVVSIETSRSKKIFKGGSLESAILHCTACNKQLGVDGLMDYHRHPMLKVLICRKCYNWYIGGEIEQDTDGTDEQCRWCRQGGDLVCCDFCHNSFCKSCIRRNLGRKELGSILDADDTNKWKCYVCDPKRLLGLIEHCSGVMEALAKQEKKQQEMEMKRRRNVKPTATPSVQPPVVGISGPLHSTLIPNQPTHVRPVKFSSPVASFGRPGVPENVGLRTIQPKPSIGINHSMCEVSYKPISSIAAAGRPQTLATPTLSKPQSIYGSSACWRNPSYATQLSVVEKLISLTCDVETSLMNLSKDLKEVNRVASTSLDALTRSADSTSSVTSSSTSNAAKMTLVSKELLKTQGAFLESFRVTAGINDPVRSKTVTRVSSSGVPVVSLLSAPGKTPNVLPSLVREIGGKHVSCGAVTTQPKIGLAGRTGLPAGQIWLVKEPNCRVTLAPTGQLQVNDSCKQPPRGVIKINSSSGIPLILNDPSGQKRVVITSCDVPIVVKPVVHQPGKVSDGKHEAFSKANEILVISDSDDEVEKPATINLPEIIIHDIVVDDSITSSLTSPRVAAPLPPSSNISTIKSNNLVLTDKVLNGTESESLKKFDEDCKTTLRHKRKKENEDECADGQNQSTAKRFKDDGSSSPKKDKKEKSIATHPSTGVANHSARRLSSLDKNGDPERPSDDVEPEDKPLRMSSDFEAKNRDVNEAETKVPKKRGRKRKLLTAVEPQQKQNLSPAPRRSSRRISLPMAEKIAAEVGPRSGRKSNDDKHGSNKVEVDCKLDKKKKVERTPQADPPSRSRRSLAAIPENRPSKQKDGVTTRAANRKSAG